MSQPRPPISGPPTLSSLDSGHATMTSTSSPHPHHSSHLTTGTRGPLRATIRPRGLPSSHPPSSLSSHRRSCSVDSIGQRSEATPTNYSQQPPSLSSRRSPLHSSSENMASMRASNSTTRATISTTRANHWNQGRGSNKENSRVGSGNVAPLKTRGSSGSAPFKDRTNTSQISNNLGQSVTEGERKMGKGNSLSELTPPLNAARLRPIRQSTRTATVNSPFELMVEKVFFLFS